MFSGNPFMVWFSSDGVKDSVTFARETGEFVANLVGRDLAEKMIATSIDAPRGVSEFDHAGLTPAPVAAGRRRRASPRRWPRSNAR